VLVPARGLVLYFGTDMPDPTWAGSLRDVDVVLQPYHPAVKYGGYAESFPHARRWVYANPTTVDPWILERAVVRPPIASHDPAWNLPRLDLDQPAGRAWAVAHLCEVARYAAAEAHGIFVDDLDRLTDQPDLALDLLAAARSEGVRAPRWFVNRAFGLLDRVEGLDAVLLECLTPAVAAAMDVDGVRWVREVVLPALERAVLRGVSCHSLDYPDQPGLSAGRTADEGVERAVSRLLCSVTHASDRGLTAWQVRSSRPTQKV
jgi:hypothetical protein